MQGNAIETIVGALVVVVAAAFLYVGYQAVEIGAGGGYEITARFDRVDGISIGSDVRISGIKVGTVSSLELDQKTYLAAVAMDMTPSVKIPEDSSVKITSEGLLGGSYLSLEPGGSEEFLADGGELVNTQGSIDFIGLIGRAIFGSTESEGNSAP